MKRGIERVLKLVRVLPAVWGRYSTCAGLSVRLLIVTSLLIIGTAVAANTPPMSDYSRARAKFAAIQYGHISPGTSVVLTQSELNAYVRHAVAVFVPQGVRNPRVELAYNRASGFGLVDFAKVGGLSGHPPGWLARLLLSGERNVRVDAHIRSGNGRAQVDLDRVEVSGIAVSGAALDYLIRNFLWPYFPDAVVGKPFLLAHNIDRLDIQPGSARVVMRGRGQR